MTSFFYRQEEYKLPDKMIGLDLRSIFKSWENGKEYGELKLLRIKSEQNFIYHYLCSSRAGVITVELLRKDDNLIVHIKEQVMGFFLPLVFLSLTLAMIFIQRFDIALVFCIATLFFLGIIYFSFIEYSNDIKRKVIELIGRYYQ